MGIISKIEKGIVKAEKKYKKTKESTKNIRRVGGKIFDFIIPPPKKKKQPATTQKAKTTRKGKTTTYTSGKVTCTCKSK